MNSLYKFLIFLYFFALTCFYVLVFLVPFNFIPYNTAFQVFNNIFGIHKWYYFTAALLLIIFNIFLTVSLFRGGNEAKLGVLKRMPDGDMYISNETIKSLALKIINQTRGVRDVKIMVKPGKDNINILVKVLIIPDIKIPDTIKEIQQNIKKYIESIAEIPVGEIKVVVQDVAQSISMRFE